MQETFKEKIIGNKVGLGGNHNMSLIEREKRLSKEYQIKTTEIEYCGKQYVTADLTLDNVAKIEAIVSLDSNYRNAFNEEKEPVNGKGGSTAFWCKKLRELPDDYKNSDYKNIISHLVISIDNENSTHLNSDGIGREAVVGRLVKITPSKLVELLRNDNNKFELIKLIQTPIKKGENNHFSFATKFCHYLCMNRVAGKKYEDTYSIYDSVLRTNLPLYIKRYLNEEVKKDIYEGNYPLYMSYIDRIRKAAKKLYGDEISRNGFDRLIWYYHKG